MLHSQQNQVSSLVKSGDDGDVFRLAAVLVLATQNFQVALLAPLLAVAVAHKPVLDWSKVGLWLDTVANKQSGVGELSPLVAQSLLRMRGKQALASLHVSTIAHAVGITVQLGQIVGLSHLTWGTLRQNAIFVGLEVGAGVKVNQDRAAGANLFDHVFF